MIQDEVIAQLERKGFRSISRLSYGAVVMQKRTSSFGRIQVEVDEDGSVNGMSLDEYLKQEGIRASTNELIAKELVKIAKEITSAARGPIWDALAKWNELHDLEYQLGKAADEYDVAFSYGGSQGAVEAEKIMKQINQVKAELEKISHRSFDELVRMEMGFVGKYGTPDEFAESRRREIFPT